MAISITSTQLESHSNWDVFPTQVIYENWDEDELNDHEELERFVMFNGSLQMCWNELCYRSPKMHWNNYAVKIYLIGFVKQKKRYDYFPT